MNSSMRLRGFVRLPEIKNQVYPFDGLCSRCPTGEPYATVRTEGATEKEVVDRFLSEFGSMVKDNPDATLYWRRKPEIRYYPAGEYQETNMEDTDDAFVLVEHPDRYSVYSRFKLSNEPINEEYMKLNSDCFPTQGQ